MKVKELFENYSDNECIELKSDWVYSYDYLNTDRYKHDPINVTGAVDLNFCNFENGLPWKFNKILGNGAVMNSGWYAGTFSIYESELYDFNELPHHISKRLNIGKNNIRSLVGVHKHFTYCKEFWCKNIPIEEGGIGLLLIPGLQEIVANHPALEIIAKYAGRGKTGIIACQKELIENGYEKFAKI